MLAFSTSSSINKSTIIFPFFILPAAFILGPILNEIFDSSILLLIDFKKFLSPILGFEFIILKPWKTIILFSSTRGIISETVAIAVKSMKSLILHGSSEIKLWAVINLNAIPHPHNSLKGYLQSNCFGLIIPYAFGKLSSGRWWSQIITSIPFEFAKSTGSMALIPQSTVMINEKLFFSAYSIDSIDTPYPSLYLSGM